MEDAFKWWNWSILQILDRPLYSAVARLKMEVPKAAHVHTHARTNGKLQQKAAKLWVLTFWPPASGLVCKRCRRHSLAGCGPERTFDLSADSWPHNIRTNRQTDKWIDSHRYVDRHKSKQIHGQTDIEIDRYTKLDRPTSRNVDR